MHYLEQVVLRKKGGYMRKVWQFLSGKIYPILALLLLLIIWQIASSLGLVPAFLLPSPIAVVQAFIGDFPLLMYHSRVTLIQAMLGLSLGTLLGFLVAVVMEHFIRLHQALYPLIVVSQTIPAVAIAPLLVLWFGHDMLPKIILIILMTFFPITVGLLDGFRSADQDTIRLLKSMKASQFQIFRFVKLPASLGYFFAGLRISAAYSIVGSVISEWLGGFAGLGVYMTRVQRAFSFDRMFAVIFLISILSLLLMKLVKWIEKKSMPWERKES